MLTLIGLKQTEKSEAIKNQITNFILGITLQNFKLIQWYLG